MQLLTTTFLFTIIPEDSTSENRDSVSFSIISLTECQEALSERQFVKQTGGTYFVWSWYSRMKRWYWFLHVLGTNFFKDISLDNETTMSSAQMEGVYGDSNVR